MKTERRGVKMLALKPGVMWPQTKEPRPPPEAGGGEDRVLHCAGSMALLTP